jgi:hypothetical protein
VRSVIANTCVRRKDKDVATALISECEQTDTGALERVNYFPRQLLTADDMVADQDYVRAKLRRHNRYLHGWGVVCGLEVVPAPANQLPWQVQIASGYALGPYGDEIYLSQPVLLDLAKCGPGAETDPCDPGTLLKDGQAKTGATLYIAIRYEECFARPVRVMPGGCGCEDTSCEPSRIRDSFQIECLADLPPSHQQGAAPSICDLLTGRALAPCVPCPTDPWIVLARVTLPAAASTTITAKQVDNFVRRQVFSTAAIQDQVIRCCCTARDKQPARVTSINPPVGAIFDTGTAPSVIVTTFSKNLRPETVTPSSFIVSASIGGQTINIPGTVAYDAVNRSAQFTPTGTLSRPGTYQITLVGSGPNPIIDADDLALDGNDDGVPGGNFISTFTVGQTTPPPQPIAVKFSAEHPTTIRSGQQQGQNVGDLVIEIGAIPPASLPATATLTLSLSANVSPFPGESAQLTDSTGSPAVTATKGTNTYTFSGIPLASTSLFHVVKMRVVNAPVGPIDAQLTITTVPALTFEATPKVVVATSSLG